MSTELETKKYTKEDFTLVQSEDRLIDQPFKTKQLSYFQDSMIRFGKNKVNLVATFILLVFILMAILVPALSTSNFKDVKSELSLLPPRVPLLEKFGIFDGSRKFTDVIVDPRGDTYKDPETGLYYPQEYNVKYMIKGTLSNRTATGTIQNVLYIGGTNVLKVDNNKGQVGIYPQDGFAASTSKNTKIKIDIKEFSGAGTLEVYYFNGAVKPTSWNDPNITKIGTITTAGEHIINPFDSFHENIYFANIMLKYTRTEVIAQATSQIVLNSVTIQNNDGDIEFSGYDLNIWKMFAPSETEDGGTFRREDAVVTYASFKYYLYKKIFDDRRGIIGGIEYDKILSENPDMIFAKIPDPSDPTNNNKWIFDPEKGNWPIKAVIDVKKYSASGITATNYEVIQDGAYVLGFSDTPYFLFGTDVGGKDLFTLIWLGLRTSLLLGIISSAINIVIGILFGSIAAYYGGQVDLLMERFTEIWSSFPSITMIAIITALLKPGFTSLLVFMVYDGWVGVAYVTRMQFYRYKGREYVLAARTLGAGDFRIIFKHILPNALGTIVTRVVLSIPSVIFLEANLSFLGFGIGSGSKLYLGPIELTGTSIGVLLAEGQASIYSGYIWLIFFPALIVSILMITFNMFGNALRDALNPQLRGN